MAASWRGVKKYKEWMAAIEVYGWQKSTWGALADLWWLHHDDDGNLK